MQQAEWVSTGEAQYISYFLLTICYLTFGDLSREFSMLADALAQSRSDSKS